MGTVHTVHPRAAHYQISKHFPLISNYHTIYTPSPASRTRNFLLLGWANRHPLRVGKWWVAQSWMLLLATITTKWLVENANRLTRWHWNIHTESYFSGDATRIGLEPHQGTTRDRCWYWKDSSKEQPSELCKLSIPSPHAHQVEGSLNNL